MENFTLAAAEAEKAMSLAVMLFAFPVRVFMTYIYAHKTNTEYSMKTEDYFDFLISGLIAIWVVAYFIFTNRTPENPLLSSDYH